MIDGHFENLKVYWEMTRIIAFNVAAYGNSDPKRFPKSAQKFMPFDWDEKNKVSTNSILQQHERMKQRRQELMKKHGHPIL